MNPRKREFEIDDLTSSQAFDLLREVESTPDLSGRIMNRLGYMRTVDSVARQRRIRRAVARGGVVLLLLSMTVVTIHARGQQDDIRRPAEVTLPAAMEQVGHDVTQQRERLNRLLQHIRVIPADQPQTGPAGDEEESSDTPPFDDEVNRSGLLPYKWA